MLRGPEERFWESILQDRNDMISAPDVVHGMKLKALRDETL